MAHSDLWQQILFLMRLHRTTVRFFWLPSNVGIVRNEGANAPAAEGMLLHPNNCSHQVRRPKVEFLGECAAVMAIH